MRNYPTCLAGCVVAAIILTSPTSQAADPTDKSSSDRKVPFLGPPPPEELRVLAPLVGVWNTEIVARPSLESPEGLTAKGEVVGQWLHNNHFLRLEGASQWDNGRLEYTALFAYDREQKAYRRWAFTSAGVAAQSAGQWDAAARTMIWTNRTPQVTAVVKQILEKDRFVETYLFTRDDGTIVRDSTLTATLQEGQELEEKHPVTGPTAPEELQVLAPFVGAWTTEAEIRPSVNNNVTITAAGEAIGQWLHNGHFLRLEGFFELDANRLEWTYLMNYDPQRGTYRRWVFSSLGQAVEAQGQWNERAQTMTWTRDVPNETRVIKDVLKQDGFVETLLFKRDDGTVLLDETITAVRKKLPE